MNEYDELQDFEHHRSEFEALRWHLRQAGASALLDGARVLDIGGGAGMHAGFLAQHARRVTSIDMVDPNVTYGGEFLKLIRQKYARHGVDLDISKVEFHYADAMDLPYKDGLFDLVVSWNAFEHIRDPKRALREAMRVTRPGGLLFVTFDPIWTADTGSHFSVFVHEPWAHLVLNESEFTERMRNAGATEEQVREFLTAMNKVRLTEFEQIFETVAASEFGAIEFRNSWSGTVDKRNTAHANYFSALALGYSKRELLTRGLSFVIRRSAKGAFAAPQAVTNLEIGAREAPQNRVDGASETPLLAALENVLRKKTTALHALARFFVRK